MTPIDDLSISPTLNLNLIDTNFFAQLNLVPDRVPFHHLHSLSHVFSSLGTYFVRSVYW